MQYAQDPVNTWYAIHCIIGANGVCGLHVTLHRQNIAHLQVKVHKNCLPQNTAEFQYFRRSEPQNLAKITAVYARPCRGTQHSPRSIWDISLISHTFFACKLKFIYYKQRVALYRWRTIEQL